MPDLAPDPLPRSCGRTRAGSAPARGGAFHCGRRRAASRPASVRLDQIVGWIVTASISLGNLVVLGIVFLAADNLPGWLKALLPLVWFLITLALAWISYRWPEVEHRHTSYKVDGRGIEIRKGVIWRAVIHVPSLPRAAHRRVARPDRARPGARDARDLYGWHRSRSGGPVRAGTCHGAPHPRSFPACGEAAMPPEQRLHPLSILFRLGAPGPLSSAYRGSSVLATAGAVRLAMADLGHAARSSPVALALDCRILFLSVTGTTRTRW